MYVITESDMVSRIESRCRTWRLLIQDRTTGLSYSGESCMRAASDAETTAEADDIELGAVCAVQWDISIYDPHGTKFLGHELDISLYLKTLEDTEPVTFGDLEAYTCGEIDAMTVRQIEQLNEMIGSPIPMATGCVVIRSRRNDELTELTVCDKLCYADQVYTPSDGVTFPCSSNLVEQDVLSQLGLESGVDYYTSALLRDSSHRLVKTVSGQLIRVTAFEFTISRTQIPEGCTLRQMLGYIASAMGQFGYIDRFGRYIRKWYTVPASPYVLSHSTVSAPTLSEQSNIIAGIVCTTGETVRRRGDTTGQTGRVLEFENPFMTDVLFKSLWHRLSVQGLEWYTAEVRQLLGDPRLDPGDVVIWRDRDGTEHNIPITSLSFGFDGGLWADIRAVGRSYEEEVLMI